LELFGRKKATQALGLRFCLTTEGDWNLVINPEGSLDDSYIPVTEPKVIGTTSPHPGSLKREEVVVDDDDRGCIHVVKPKVIGTRRSGICSGNSIGYIPVTEP